ncbi:MAG: hypothetical protein LUG89_05245 [Methanosphaera sp.]|nr:hypothetical protein [Methanosphaera sp.]
MLEIEYKKKSADVVDAMTNSLRDDHDYYSEAIGEINKLVASDEIHIVNSANSAILTVMEAVCDPILIPDMGGWNGVQRSCDVLNKEVIEFKTDKGMINIEELDEYLKSNTVNSLYITSLIGYNASHKIDEISRLCNLHEVTLIIDISPTIGDSNISNKYGDIQIASTGSPKIINIENGGFIVNITRKVELNKHLLKTFKADNTTCAGISVEIEKAGRILEDTRHATTYLREKLLKSLENDNLHNIVYDDENGLNIIITAPSKKKAKTLAYKIRSQINVSGNHSIITTTPNYNRLKIPGIVVEVKNINTSSITMSLLDQLCDIIISSIKEVGE